MIRSKRGKKMEKEKGRMPYQVGHKAWYIMHYLKRRTNQV